MTQQLPTPDAVVVKIDAALKKLYAQALAQLDEARAAGGAAWHLKYITVAAIIEHVPPMYLAGGFATDSAFIESELQETRQLTYRNMRVAKLATAEEVATYSAARLNFAIAYVEARDKAPIKNSGAIDFTALKIHFKRDGKTHSQSLLEIAYADLVLAVSQATGHEAKAVKQSPAAKAVTAAVKASGVKDAKATITKTMVTIRVPLAGLSAVARELADFKLPTE